MKSGLLVLLGVTVSILGAPVLQPAAAGEPVAAGDTATHRALLDRYCVTCHNTRLKTAGLALDVPDLADVASDADVWEKVIRKLRSEAMPPPRRPRPEPAASDALASYLEHSLDAVAEAHPNPGRNEPFHRLNRAEYANAIRDLLALEIDVSSLLPADDTDEHGFDNMAEVLSVSPALLERYMSAARKISWLAVGLPPLGPVTSTYGVPLLMYQDDRLGEDLPFGSRGGLAVRHRFPVDGEYFLKIRLQRTYVDYIRGLGTPQALDVRIDGVRVKRFVVGGAAPPTAIAAPASFAGNPPLYGNAEWEEYILNADNDLEVRFAAKAGTRTVSVAFERKLSEPEGVLQPRQTGFPLAINERWDGNAAVDHFEVSGPFAVDGPGDTPSRTRIFSCHPSRGADADQCAREILSTLARRAYRRPVTEADVETLYAFYEPRRETAGFEAGIQLALQRILADPEFIFRVARDPSDVPAATSYAISDVELASRLSFFLWSSIPDDQLMDLAERGVLRDPEVLQQQVDRMLADPRADALVENFAGQWLLLRNVETVTPDPIVFPEFDENLRDAFREETELFVASQLREDRSALDLLTAEYTYVNERLAQHYGIHGIYGNRFRRVSLADARLGGLLGHGSLLTVTSYPNRTSPVLRGKWVLENLLGAPPPPPPPDVPGLPERGEGGKPASVRELMEQHRENPVCATCHAPMDPLGFALENFDAIGKWRTTEAKAPIDPSGTLPNGTAFEGPHGLRSLLASEPERFVGTVTEKLLAYALGRSLEYYDQPAVRQIVREAASDDYRWSSLVLEIVQSTPFQMRRSASS